MTATYYTQPRALTAALIIGAGILGAILAMGALGLIEIAITNRRRKTTR